MLKMSGNLSNLSDCLIDDNSFIFTAFTPYILVISVLGIIFNLFVLMVFCLHKKSCTVAEIYLSNLTGAHLSLMYCLPFISDYGRNVIDWPFSESLCKLVPAVANMNAFCSIYFLVLVSIDHYVALVHPLFHELMSRPFYAKLGCLFVWVLGLVFALPTFIYRKLSFDPQSNTSECGSDSTLEENHLFEVRTIIFGFIIPVIIILFCTVGIIQTSRKRLMKVLKPERTEQKTTTLILAVLLSYLICWVPFHVSMILDLLEYTDILKCHIILNIFTAVSMNLFIFNSVLNPILYVIIGKSFWNRTKEFFKR